MVTLLGPSLGQPIVHLAIYLAFGWQVCHIVYLPISLPTSKGDEYLGL